MKLAEKPASGVAVATAPQHSHARVESIRPAVLLDAVFANSREAVVVVDEIGAIVYASPGAGMLLGHNAASKIGSSIFDFLHLEDVEAAAQLFVQRLAYDGADLGHVVRVRHSSGEWIPMVATVAMLADCEFGACAITLRTPGADDFVERSLRSQVVVGAYTNRLSTGFMEATSSSEVLERIVASSGEIGLLTGAEVVEVFLEDELEGLIERLAGWVSPERLADASATADVQPAAEALFDGIQVFDDLHHVDDCGIAEFAARTGAVSLLSAPFQIGAQRGVLVLMRVAPGPNWIAADVELARSTASLYGRALQTARSEELLSLTYQQGPLGFSIRTWGGDLVDCNQQYLDLFGLTREAADQIVLPSLLSDTTSDSTAATLDEMRRGVIDRLSTNVEVTRGDGSRFWAHTHSVPLRVPGRSETLVLTSIEDVTEIHVQRIELEHAAQHDSLTGVANRGQMSDAIDRFRVLNGKLPAVVIVDIDRFKLINDSFGHAVGDEVLQVVAERISSQLRPGDVVARLGGDEFAIVIQHLSRADAVRLAQRLLRAIEAPLEIDGRLIDQTMSVGVALSEGSQDPADLLKRADRALYAAKAAGRNTHVVFDESLEVEVLARQALERELDAALAAGELEIQFQPEFSLVDGRVLGAEALLRWEHPHRGLISAGAFLPAAEQSGLIDEIGRFALREACRKFVTIPGTEGLMLRVNISAREFSRPELPDLVEAALAESGLEPERLCLEMTETTLMDARELVLPTFARLSALGVKSAIDDFGTGYSSLSHLKRFPVDTLKIDSEFILDLVGDPESRAIVESILQLAGAMGMDVVAEGVETVDQVEVLHHLGCLRAQGYLVSPALPCDEFGDFLSNWVTAPQPHWAHHGSNPARTQPRPIAI
jgi:diguanylate cyclase (GGDEF)-like protein/PAS domain S-box-containing protein